MARAHASPPPAAAVDELFKLPLEQFTAARNALVARLKRSGHAEQADQVKALNKPPLSAWAVNQLFWHHRKAFDDLLATGEKFRQAQAAKLGGKASDLRGALEARRESLAALTQSASALLRDAGHTPGPDIMRRVTTTLEALASYGTHPDAPEAGRLTGDVDAPGFEALAALVPQLTGSSTRTGEPRVLPFRQQKAAAARASRAKLSPDEARQREAAERRARRAAAKAAVHDAEKTLREARRLGERAEASLKKAAAAAKEAEKAKTELEARYEKAKAAADAARQEARRVASDAEEAAQAVEDAERALEKSQRELEQLEE
jgi:hypothetical protein